MFLIYYTSQKINGNNDPFGDNFDEKEVLYKSIAILYRVCEKEQSFSLAHLISIENAIKKEHPQYYNEFMENYYKSLHETLKKVHGE